MNFCEALLKALLAPQIYQYQSRLNFSVWEPSGSHHSSRSQGPHHVVMCGGPVNVEALQQFGGDDQRLSLGIPRYADALPVVLDRLVPLAVPEHCVALIQQVAHQLGQKSLGQRGYGWGRFNGVNEFRF